MFAAFLEEKFSQTHSTFTHGHVLLFYVLKTIAKLWLVQKVKFNIAEKTISEKNRNSMKIPDESKECI